MLLFIGLWKTNFVRMIAGLIFDSYLNFSASDGYTWEVERDAEAKPVVAKLEVFNNSNELSKCHQLNTPQVAVGDLLPPSTLAGLKALLRANKCGKYVEGSMGLRSSNSSKKQIISGLMSFLAPEALNSVRRKLVKEVRNVLVSRVPNFLSLHTNSSRYGIADPGPAFSQLIF